MYALHLLHHARQKHNDLLQPLALTPPVGSLPLPVQILQLVERLPAVLMIWVKLQSFAKMTLCHVMISQVHVSSATQSERFKVTGDGLDNAPGYSNCLHIEAASWQSRYTSSIDKAQHWELLGRRLLSNTAQTKRLQRFKHAE
jgi:hypothetical protein